MEGVGAVMGVETVGAEETTDGALLIACAVIRFSIHACCSGVNRGVGDPRSGLCGEAIGESGRGKAERVGSGKSRVWNTSGKVMSSNKTVVGGAKRL